MSIPLIKSTFSPTTSGIFLSPTVAAYHPVVVGTISSALMNPPVSTNLSKLSVNLPPIVSTISSSASSPSPSPFRFNGGGSPTPVSPTPPSSQTNSTSSVSVVPPGSIPISDQGSFPSGSSVLAAVFQPNGEKFTGRQLSDQEKPKIVAILSQNMTMGIPTKNLIFFRPITSVDKKATKYQILRKNVLTANDFVEIYHAQPTELTPVSSRPDILDQYPTLINAGYVVEDSDLVKNTIYIYKLQTTWVNKTADEIATSSQIQLQQQTNLLLGDNSWQSLV